MSTNPVTSVDMQIKRGTARRILWPIKFLMYIVVAFWMLFSVLLCFTLLGIPLGILSFIGAAGMMAMLRGHYRTMCPHCHYSKIYVAPRALNFKCRKCKNLTVVNWH